MAEAKTEEQRKEATQQSGSKKSTSSSSSRSSGAGKAVEHLAEAVKKVAERVTFLSENDQRDVTDHLAAANAHSRGDSQAAKEAQERIAERNPEA